MLKLRHLSLLGLLISSMVLGVVPAPAKQQQHADPKTTPGYDASAAAHDAADIAKDTSTPAVSTATNAYEGEVAADLDSPLSEDDLASVFKPIYSSTDESTHADASHGPQHQHTPPHAATAEKGSLHPTKLDKSAPTHAVEQAKQSVSIDDLMLGVDSSPAAKAHQESAPNQYEGEEAVADDGDEPVAGKLLESGQPGGKTASKYTAGPSAPGAFTGGPTLARQHQGWRFDNPETADGE